MTATVPKETGSESHPGEVRQNMAEILKICQAEVIKRLSEDPKNSWRVPYIKEALATKNYEGSSMELLAHEVNKMAEKYF